MVTFVCLKAPFVGSTSTVVLPSVGPFVPFDQERHFSAGFTLIEALTVLIVVGILAAIAIPNFGPFIQNQRISGQANDLVTDLALARSEAIKRAIPVTVCKTANPSPTADPPVCNETPSDPWTTGRIVFVDNDGDGVIDSNEEILRVRQALEGAQNRLAGQVDATGTTTGTINRVTFNPNGSRKKLTSPSAADSENQLRLCDKRGSAYGRAIVINPLGRVRVADPGKDMSGGASTCPP